MIIFLKQLLKNVCSGSCLLNALFLCMDERVLYKKKRNSAILQPKTNLESNFIIILVNLQVKYLQTIQLLWIKI
jgi:hypothetical protein